MTMPNDPSAGENPTYGTPINYWLGSEPSGSVTIRIENSSGETIRTLSGTSKVGLNRIHWDIRSEPSTEVRLRTKPLYADWVDLGPDGWRSGGGQITILEPPGEYTVVLSTGTTTQSQSLTVMKDRKYAHGDPTRAGWNPWGRGSILPQCDMRPTDAGYDHIYAYDQI